MPIAHKIGKKKSRSAGRPSDREVFTTGFQLLYPQKKFEAEVCQEQNISSTQLYESLIEMLRADPKSFKLFNNPLINRNQLRPIEGKISA